MFKELKHRAVQEELMDDFSSGGEELRQALRHLRRLNRIFGAAGPTVYGFRRLWLEAGKPQSLSILDVGAGSGDVNRHLLRWADENGVKLSITLVDITEEACEEARQLFRNEPRVSVRRSSLFQLPEQSVDITTGTQFVHHFTDAELPQVVDCMLKASRIGVVINDIHRHWLAWMAVWVTARVISKNRYIRNDGPLSVAKGFRAGDWHALRKAMNISEMFVSWRPLFRYAVVIQKRERV
ncbi:stilbene synthase [Paenibacillus pectinilyticus]|uniref:Stilbene synthase n=1 Tax=Paenibacillus pectinilyticus TaxID=512399 RepID=A0A1C1A489_9BACL|nr:SAM-dependent methyltransferase [Paenibacillus pectinilyticus]OCT15381.1 stilbene synthase [Paenibacillus pectinilyticus]